MKDKDDKKLLIVTHSRKGFTDNMAKAIEEGANFPEVETVIKRISDVQLMDLAEADAIAMGSPVYLGYITGELKHLLDRAYYKFIKKEKNRLKAKPAAAYVCGRYKGYYLKKLQFRSNILKQLEDLMFKFLKMKKVTEGIHLVHDIENTDPRAPLALTQEQRILCGKMGKKLAEEIITREP